MTALKANLRLYYQNKGLIIGYLIIPLCALIPFWPIYRGTAGTGLFALSTTMLIFFAAYIVSIPQYMVLSRPFHFVLPNGQIIQRRIAFIVGCAVSLLSTLLYLTYLKLTNGSAHLWTMAALPAAAMSLFLLVFGLTFRLMLKITFRDFQYFLMLFFLLFGATGGLYYLAFNIIIFSHPFPVFAIASFICAIAWKMMANPDLARKYCGYSYRLLNCTVCRQKPVPATTGMRERFFLPLMSNCSSVGPWRVVLGAAYMRLRSLTGRYWYLAAVILVLGIFPGGYLKWYFFLLIGMTWMMPPVASPIGSPMLLTMGRFERLISGIVVALTELLVAFAVIMFAITFSHMAGYYLPLPYQPPQLSMLYFLLILMPLNQTYNLLLARKHFFWSMALVCICLPLMLFYVFSLKMQPLSHAVVLPLVLLTHGILWSLMAYECYRRDLFIAQQLSHGLHPMQL